MKSAGGPAMRTPLMAMVAAVVCVAGLVTLMGQLDDHPDPPRIALYGDSLAMQSAQDFQSLAAVAGSPVLLAAYNGLAVCDVLPRLRSDASLWHPDVALLEFSGNNFTGCMNGYELGTAAYFAKYLHATQTAIDILRSHHVRVVLIGVPLDAWAGLSQNVTRLNALYAQLAAANPGVSYVDAGQSVLSAGHFTWTLPCLPSEPCANPAGTTTVRAPDGVHFCPTGRTTIEGPFSVCDTYSSGALRFAAAMLGAALRGQPRPATAVWRPLRPVRTFANR